MAQSIEIPEGIRRTAAQCRHYSMCKIDYLDTGLCPPAAARPYVGYFPQGRMDICHALAERLLPVTERVVDIISSCTLCGRCDKQCHFAAGLRPVKVMEALKTSLDSYLKAGGRVEKVQEDETLRALRQVVGAEWAGNDPADRIPYANDPFPLAGMRMPGYVVLPKNAEEMVRIVRAALSFKLPYVVRGNGASVFGFVFTDGIVIDVNRMKQITIDEENWTASVEPGVTSFELQKEAACRGFRVNTAEPAATVCGNLVCTGTFSTWANAYGVGSDNFVDMEFVDGRGEVFRLNDTTSPNLFAFRHAVAPSPGICTQAHVRMHPTTDDEEGVMVPFSSLSDAVSFAADLSRRRIGLAIGVLGGHYLSTFLSPSAALAEKIKSVFGETLGIESVVFVIGDRFARESIGKMAPCVIDSRLFRIFLLGLPRLADPEWRQIAAGLDGRRPIYERLLGEEMIPILEAVLAPSPETLAEAVEDDLKEFYIDLYRRPHMTSMVWLNMFRIVSCRMSRHKHMFAFLLYVPPDKIELIRRIIGEFERIAEAHGISHDFGFLTPIDFGKRAILEYDYYIDHTDPSEKPKIEGAMAQIEPMLDQASASNKGVKWLKYIFSQGCSRKEGYLYL